MQAGKGVRAFDPDLLLLLSEDDAADVRGDAELLLTPGQRKTADELLVGLSVGSLCLLQGDAGTGRTLVLRHVARTAGGAFLSIGRFVSLLRDRSPSALEETFLELLEDHLHVADLLIVDDLHLFTQVVDSFNYSRTNLFACALTALLERLERDGKRLLFATDLEEPAAVLRRRAYCWRLPAPKAADYETVCRHYLGGTPSRLDFEKLHDFAPSLNYYQLKNACLWLRREAEVTQQAFNEYLSNHNMVSNVDMDEVEPVDWKQLKGVDEVIRELETKIVLPFENQALARRLQLKPKRGVLLAGPPGTGKTTIGRALAHRLRSRFFLIDGTIVAGSHDFYEEVERVFADAKRNAPAIIFIDDADVIFEEGNRGFYRYLLTMMDGLESASAERVCVMLTAMDASSLPPAMLRSGRIELWLHVGLPAEAARREILLDKIRTLPLPFAAVDVAKLATASKGLTGADLKAVVEDAKLLFAHDQKIDPDQTIGGDSTAVEQYFLRAIAALRSSRAGFRSKKGSPLLGNTMGFPTA